MIDLSKQQIVKRKGKAGSSPRYAQSKLGTLIWYEHEDTFKMKLPGGTIADIDPSSMGLAGREVLFSHPANVNYNAFSKRLYKGGVPADRVALHEGKQGWVAYAEKQKVKFEVLVVKIIDDEEKEE